MKVTVSVLVFVRNNHHGSQKQMLLDAPVQLSQISADSGKDRWIRLL